MSIYGHLWPVFATKSVLKCDRTSHGRKRAARTHNAHTLQNAFRTHIAHVRVCAHVCVCEFKFATHSFAKQNGKNWNEHKVEPNLIYCVSQTVSCEIKFAHAHVRAHSHVCDVRAKSLLKCVCDVRACSRF